MKLTYRGVRYASAVPSFEATETSEQGTFLGARFNRKTYQVANRNAQSKGHLRFLGQSYLA
jgi:hypothetical protein